MDTIVAVIGFVVTISSIFISNYLSKQKQLKFDKQKLKQQFYMSYINHYNSHINNPTKQSTQDLCNAHNNLFLVGSIDVINKLQYFDELLTNDGLIAKDKYNLVIGTKEHNLECRKRFTLFVKSMREDLYGELAKDFPDLIIKSYNRQENL